MMITTKAVKVWIKLSSNEALFGDIFVSIFKTVDWKNAEKVYYCGTVKTSRRRFWLDPFKKIKDYPGGYSLFKKSILRFFS